MSTLTTRDGIVWGVISHNGKAAFVCGQHAITFEPATGLRHLKENGETVFAAKTSSEVLEAAPEIMWDYHASQLIPSWET